MNKEQRQTDKLSFKQKMLNTLSLFHALISNTDENDLNIQEATNQVDEAFSLPENIRRFSLIYINLISYFLSLYKVLI